jgi:hypothetical protein
VTFRPRKDDPPTLSQSQTREYKRRLKHYRRLKLELQTWTDAFQVRASLLQVACGTAMQISYDTFAGRQRMVLERWTNPKLSRRTCSPRYGLQSCRGKSAGVAKRPRERSPTRNP